MERAIVALWRIENHHSSRGQGASGIKSSSIEAPEPHGASCPEIFSAEFFPPIKRWLTADTWPDASRHFSCGADSATTYLAGEAGKHPAYGRMSDTVIRRAARALNPDRPLRAFAEMVHRPRSTIKSWTTGQRRPPIWTLKILRETLHDRQGTLFALIRELDYVIAKRECEPRHRTGFNEIKVRDGPGSIPRDGRNRRGRPRRAVATAE